MEKSPDSGHKAAQKPGATHRTCGQPSESEQTGRLPRAQQLEGVLPPELLALERWLPWLPLPRSSGGIGKVPAMPWAGRLRPVDSRRAGLPWQEALALAKQHCAGGVGIVLSPGTGLVALDLDGPMPLEIRSILTQIDGYAEYSPSGHGVHVWLSGTLPRSRREHGAEWLSQGYVTVTAQALPGRPRQLGMLAKAQAVMGPGSVTGRSPLPGPITPHRPARLDSEILTHLQRARNGARALRLLAGHWQEAGYGSRSEADFAAVRMLAFYSRDLHQIERLLRASGLAREKYQQPGYLARTITRAVERGGPTWQPTGRQP
jgi:primase-polymerase (primpol)-like protein